MNECRYTDAVSLLKSLAPESVGLIVADPPYGIAYHSNHYKDRNPHRPMTNDWDFQPGAFFNAAAVVLKDTGAMYVFTRWDVYPLWAPWIQPPLKLKNLIVWKKDNWSAGDLEGDFGNQHEVIMFVTKGRHKIRGHRWSNIWEFPRIPSKKLRCPAEKPLALVQRMVESSSDKTELVLDPFSGSGTTADAAQSLGRDFIVSDVDPNMIRVTCGRCKLSLPANLPKDTPPSPECPILHIIPPSPSLWGLHPEDIRAFMEKVSVHERKD